MLTDESGNRRFFGVYRGVVVDNKDPLGKNRLRLQIPQVLLEEETGWAWGVFASAAVVIPKIGDGIWVIFEGGDPSHPTWLGAFNASPFSYGAFSDYTTQSITSISENYVMRIGQTDEASGVQIVGGTKIVFDNPGVYNFQWSGQFVNPATPVTPIDVKVWMRKNGVDVIGSTGIISVPAKHGTTSGHTVAGWNFVFSMAIGDYYEIMWNADNPEVLLSTYTATALPSSPSTASLVVTVTQVR